MGYQQSFPGHLLIIHVHGYVYESCQLFVDGVVGGPDSALIVIGCVFLYQNGMLCRYGVQIAVAINAAVFLVFVKCVPCAFKLHEFFLRGQVTSFAVTAQLLVIDKCKFLTGTHLINHTAYPVHKLTAQCGVIGPGVCECQCREVMPGSVSFKLGMG